MTSKNAVLPSNHEHEMIDISPDCEAYQVSRLILDDCYKASILNFDGDELTLSDGMLFLLLQSPPELRFPTGSLYVPRRYIQFV